MSLECCRFSATVVACCCHCSRQCMVEKCFEILISVRWFQYFQCHYNRVPFDKCTTPHSCNGIFLCAPNDAFSIKATHFYWQLFPNKLIWLRILCSGLLIIRKFLFCPPLYSLFLSYQWTVNSQLYCLLSASAYFPIYLPCPHEYCLRCALPLLSLSSSLPHRSVQLFYGLTLGTFKCVYTYM